MRAASALSELQSTAAAQAQSTMAKHAAERELQAAAARQRIAEKALGSIAAAGSPAPVPFITLHQGFRFKTATSELATTALDALNIIAGRCLSDQRRCSSQSSLNAGMSVSLLNLVCCARRQAEGGSCSDHRAGQGPAGLACSVSPAAAVQDLARERAPRQRPDSATAQCASTLPCRFDASFSYARISSMLPKQSALSMWFATE